MKKKLFLCPFISLVLLASLNAQNNYKKGYVITNDNDTIFGLIDFRTDAINATRCTFKSEQAEKTYYPGDIAGYRFSDEGKYYVTRDVTIDSVPQKFFLEYLVEGVMNLYYYDTTAKKYFFFEKDDKMIEISKAPDVERERRIIQDNKYKNLISYYFNDYPSIVNNLNKMDFSQKTFIEIAKTYHDKVCTTGEECVIFENKHPDENSIKTAFSVYAGVQLQTYSLNSYSGYSYSTLNRMQPVIGGKMKLFNPRWSRSFALQLDMSFSRFSFSQALPYFLDGESEFKLKAIIITGKLGAEYKFSLNKIQPMIGAGIAYTNLLGDDSKFMISEWSDSWQKYELRSPFVGCYLNIGASYMLKSKHSIFVLASMEQYLKEDTSKENYNDRFKSYNIVLGYTF